ncbi:MAG: MotA/TolQ/ExbB proton channel family protein [Opitutales bacterium]|nr:MotA/TolQ/ExbB proton channel family protein [Opitutales bacterium]
MKKLSILMFSFAMFSICVGADWAEKQLDDARKADAITSANIAKERSEIIAKIDSLSKDISAIEKEIEKLKSHKTDLLSLSEKSKFNDSILDSVLSVASRNFGRDFQNVVSLADSKNAIDAQLKKIETELFSPIEPQLASVKRAKTGELLEGKIFRVGKFKYFVGSATAGVVSEKGTLYLEEKADVISKFFNGQSNEIIADISGGEILGDFEKSRTLSEEIVLGGIWMYPILFFGLISAVVCVLKIFSFIFIRRAPKDAVKKITMALSEGDVEKAKKIASATGYPYSNLLEELVQSCNLQTSLLEEISYEHMLSAGEKLFGGLSVLSVTSAVAPLFGLLGTVTGIIKTFGDLSTRSAEQAQFISAGISEALITTEYGLIVAIPAFVVHAILSRRAKGILSDMEKLASSFLATNRK